MAEVNDLAVTNGLLVLPEGVEPGTVIVHEGRIAEILAAGVEFRAAETIDATGGYVLPGLLDSHVHFRTPGLTHKEDWAHGSRAAAAGGVTTVFDMPNHQPPLVDPALVAEKVALIEGTSLVDFRFHLGVDPSRLELLEACTPAEAVSAKVFMTSHHTTPLVVRDPVKLDRVFEICARKGIRVVLHAEDDHVFSMLDGWRRPVADYTDYEPSRPRAGGIVAAAAVIRLAEKHGAAAHVVHVSSAEEVDLYTAAAAAGLPVTFEVTSHHLAFCDHDIIRLGSRIRLSPAIRQPEDRNHLWQAVFGGHVTTLGSDHAPHTLEEKGRPPADAPPGLPGVQELATAVYTGMRSRQPGTPVAEHLWLLAKLYATNPADLFGLTGVKGRLAVGYDGDLVVFDPEHRWSLDAGTIQAKVGWSAYEGWMFTGRVRKTVRRGEVIFDAETQSFGTPNGRWLEPAVLAT